MTAMSNFPEDLVGDILSRVPLTSLSKVRCTCKTWNALSKIQIFGKETAARKHVLGFIELGYTVCSLRFDLQGILNEGDLVDPSIKQIRILDEIDISQVFHSNGLLLCVLEDNRKLMVWNPYLGQKRWIRRPRKVSSQEDMFSFGYDNNNMNNCNHKILRILEERDYGRLGNFPYSFKLYDFKSDAWRRVLDVKPEFFIAIYMCVSLKGNSYFVAGDIITKDVEKDFLLCFDFTTERFGPLLPMPYNFAADTVKLSCVGEEKLAALYQKDKTMEIWITTKILPNAVSWSKFLKVEITSQFNYRSFFIDEEKKVAIVFNRYYESKPTKRGWSVGGIYQGAYIIGEDRDFKFVNLGEAWQHVVKIPSAFSSYVPSLVQLQFNQRGKRKVKDCSYSKIKKERKK